MMSTQAKLDIVLVVWAVTALAFFGMGIYAAVHLQPVCFGCFLVIPITMMVAGQVMLDIERHDTTGRE